jgi:hypothetical protein
MKARAAGRHSFGTLAAIGIAFVLVAGACGSSATTNAPAASSRASVTPTPAASGSAASSGAPSAAEPTPIPVTADVLAQLEGLTSYKFKFTLKGGSYASSVGPAGVAGTVVNSPSFAVQFTYADLEIIQTQDKIWTRNGAGWDASPFGKTTYDSYGPAILLSHYFPASVAAYYSPVGDTAINGVLVTHYQAAPSILNSMAAYWGVKPGATLAGDIWLAKEGSYPVRWKVTGTGTDDFQFLVDITNANDPANVIHLPAS